MTRAVRTSLDRTFPWYDGTTSITITTAWAAVTTQLEASLASAVTSWQLTFADVDPSLIGQQPVRVPTAPPPTSSSEGGAATTNAAALTSGILPAARIGDASIAEAKLSSGVQTKLNAAGGSGTFTYGLVAVYNTALTAQPATGQPVANLTSVANLVAGWTVILGADLVTAERKVVASVSGNDVTFTTNITGTHPTTELVSYANQPIDVSYLTSSTYQQITGQKRFMAPVLSGLTSDYAAPGTSAKYGLDLQTGIRSRANGGGGVVVVPRAETKPVIDWINDGVTSGAYLFHLTQSMGAGTTYPGPNGASNGTLIAIGVQGSGGSGILIAKDGPHGNGLFVDQKTVVTNPAAAAINGLMSSHFAPFLNIPINEPTTAPAINLSSGATKSVPQMRHVQWTVSGVSGTGWIDAQNGSLQSQFPIIADNSLNNTNSGLWFKGRGSTTWGNAIHLDELGPNPAGGAAASEAAARLVTAAGSNQHYLGSMRISKTTQGLLIAVHSGASRIGTEAPEAMADFAPVLGARLGFGHDVAVTNLVVPTGAALSGVGATGGSTTYGYRVAAVNAKGTTLASTTVSTAVGAATLDGTNKIVVTWAAALGASSYKVYGRTAGAELLMGTVTVPTRTVTDAVMQAAATRTVTDAVTAAAGSSTITSATAAFTAADVGAKVYLTTGSGVGPGYNGYETYGTISSVVNATTATVTSVIGVAASGISMTISNPAMNRITSATAAFTAADVGRGITAPVGAAGAAVYGFVQTYESATSVLVSFAATTAIAGGTVTITGGNVPLTFTDDGTVTPAGALPGNPIGTKLSVTRWAGQSGDVFDLFDEAGVKLFSFDKNARPVAGGTAPTASITNASTAVSATGGDAAHTVNFTTSATATAGQTQVTVTFSSTYATTPKVVVTPLNAASASTPVYVTAKSNGAYSIAVAANQSTAQALSFDVHVIG